jgi:hypothetical protein
MYCTKVLLLQQDANVFPDGATPGLDVHCLPGGVIGISGVSGSLATSGGSNTVWGLFPNDDRMQTFPLLYDIYPYRAPRNIAGNGFAFILAGDNLQAFQGRAKSTGVLLLLYYSNVL